MFYKEWGILWGMIEFLFVWEYYLFIFWCWFLFILGGGVVVYWRVLVLLVL